MFYSQISSGRFTARGIAISLAAVSALLMAACRAPEGQRKQADRVGYDIIREKQEEGLGRTENFTVEQAAETLRDRLLIEQDLPRTGPASLGTNALEPLKHWPKDAYLDGQREGRPSAELPGMTGGEGLELSLNEALQVAARNNRRYQTEKETVFRTALALDLERDVFRPVFSAPVEASTSGQGTEIRTVANTANATEEGVEGTDAGDVADAPDPNVDDPGTKIENVANSAESVVVSVSQRFKQGTVLTGRVALDLTQLLTQEGGSSLGLLADTSLEVPLLRGAGRWIVTEPLTQAERDALYAIYDFERFKRTFAVEVASAYLGVLRQLDQVDNAEENYRRLVTSSRRAQALAEEGRLPEIQVDQALQDELRARNGWISAQQTYAASLDNLKILLGLPADAALSLERDTLGRLADSVKAVLPTLSEEQMEGAEASVVPAADAPIVLQAPSREDGGPLEMDPEQAIIMALEHRLDLRVAEGQVYDAMRLVAVAADAFRPELTLFASGSVGERRGIGNAALDDAQVRLDRGSYNALFRLDLPFERRVERNNYRNRWIDLERSVRDLQAVEDSIKFEIRNQLRGMLESRESLRIQAQAVKLAQRRVDSTGLLLELGRAEIRDVLEAQEALLSAQNALTSALVNYRVSELQLQADLGRLEVNEDGLWREYRPDVYE